MVSKESAVRGLATWLGCGKSPVAPGTVGTLGALPLYWAVRRLNPPAYFAVTAAVTAIGIWAAQKEAERLNDEDPSSVVIDEVAGVLLALGFVRGRSLRAEALAVVLFRLFDIWKPGPIRTAERARPAGLGIMADDIAAGAAAGLLAKLLTR
jgi:phosphatidylglycerophosphatase A